MVSKIKVVNTTFHLPILQFLSMLINALALPAISCICMAHCTISSPTLCQINVTLEA